MPIPYTPLAIANYFIGVQPCDHMKLQKLVYCADRGGLPSIQSRRL